MYWETAKTVQWQQYVLQSATNTIVAAVCTGSAANAVQWQQYVLQSATNTIVAAVCILEVQPML